MKKLLSLVLVLSFALLVAAGCSNDQPSKQGDGQQTELTPIVVGASPTQKFWLLLRMTWLKKATSWKSRNTTIMCSPTLLWRMAKLTLTTSSISPI